MLLHNFDFSDLFTRLLAWGTDYIWSLSRLFELILIATAFIASAFIARPLHAHATKAIEQAKIPLRSKRIAKNTRRLILPVICLVIMLIEAEIASADWLGLNTSLMNGVMKVMMAWVAIQLLLQFVDNTIIRNLFFWTIWLAAALSIFGVLDETVTALDATVFSFGSFRLSMLEIIKSTLLLIILLYISLFISTFFERKVLKSKGLTRSSQVLLVKIIRMLLIVVAVIIGITSSGIDLSVFAVLGGAIGLGIGLGLQRSVSNLFCGFLLLMDQSIKPGDVIELDKDGTFGVVNEMAARYTEVVTGTNKSYLIPNEDFITQRVINWSHSDRFIRLELGFGVHYKSDPHEVIKIALAVANKPGRLIHGPEHQAECFLREFGDSALNFTLRFWVTDVEQGVTNIKGEILLGLWDAFKKHNIEIPYPHREVYVHQQN